MIVLAALGIAPIVSAHASPPVFPTGEVTMRVDAVPGGGGADGHARHTSLSGDGGRIAFGSEATNLVPDDTNGVADVFLHDFDLDSTLRVSVASDGTQGDGDSGSPSNGSGMSLAISADGRFVAFESDATNLVASDTNGSGDVFVRDLETDTTTRVSVASDGTEADGVNRWVSISNDGRYVGYLSHSTTLVPNAPASGLYVHDRQTGTTELASIAYDGTPVSADLAGSLSGNGRNVVFESSEPGIVPNDTNGEYDVFERNLDTGTTVRVSVTSAGEQLYGTHSDEYSPEGPAISFDGRYVAFSSNAANFPSPPNDGNAGTTDVYVHDRQTGKTVMADVSTDGWGGYYSGYPVMSDDGRYVGFHSNSQLAPCGFRHFGFYVRDMIARTTVRVSTHADGVAAPVSNGFLFSPRMDLSADGGVASFTSDVALSPADTDEIPNVYVHDVLAPVGAPDAMIGTKLRGAGRCGPTPTFATQGLRAAPGRKVSFDLTFRNLSPSPDVLIIRGASGAPGFRVRYFKDDTDVTEAVLAGTRRTRALEWHESATYQLEVRVRAGAVPEDLIRVLVRASSRNQPAVFDVVRAKVTVSS